MDRTRCSIAEVNVDVVGNSNLAQTIANTLTATQVLRASPSPPDPALPADISLVVGGAPPAVAVERSERSRRFPYTFETAITAEGFRYRASTLRNRALYTVDLDGLPHHDQAWTAAGFIAEVGWLRWLPAPLLLAATHEHARAVDYFAAVALNEVLEPLLWTKLLHSDHTYLHAAAGITPDGRGVAFTGGGQVGKTSLALGLVHHHGWRYLADDRVILGTDGIQRTPRPLRLAPHHLSVLQDRSTVDGMSRTSRRARSRRRLAVSDVFADDQVALSAPLDLVVNVFATPSTTTVRTRKVTREQLVANATAAIIGDFWAFLHFMNAAASQSSAAAACRWHERVADIVERSFPTTILGLDIPVGYDLNDVASFVADTV